MGVVPASLDQLVGLSKVPEPLLHVAQRLLLLIELSPLSAQVGLGGHLRQLGEGGGWLWSVQQYQVRGF